MHARIKTLKFRNTGKGSKPFFTLSYRHISCRQGEGHSPCGSGSDIPDRRYQSCDSAHRSAHSPLGPPRMGYLLSGIYKSNITNITQRISLAQVLNLKLFLKTFVCINPNIKAPKPAQLLDTINKKRATIKCSNLILYL